MDSRYLSHLATIIKFGSISRAAEHLNTTQPTLSRTVQIIENQVGAPVLVRGRHGVRPTEIGARLAEAGRRILAQTEHSEAILRQWRHGLGSEIRVGVGPLLALHALHNFIQQTLSNTRYVVHFTSATASSLIRQLNRGEHDLVLAPARLDTPQEELHRTIIFHDQVAIFAGKQSRFYGSNKRLNLQDLQHETWIHSGGAAGIIEPDINELKAPVRMVFTGGVQMELALLKTSNVLISLPHRLTMMSGDLSSEHLLNIRNTLPDRDIALWIPRKSLERPDIVDLSERISQYMVALDENIP